jgi:hypothetical protein
LTAGWIFETDDGEVVAGEAVPGGVGGGTELAFGGFRPRAFLGVGSVGSEARFGNRLFSLV